MRCFIAVELSDELRRPLGRLVEGIAEARPVPPQQLHLTLAFLGELDDPSRALVCRELATVATPSFELRFARCGCFPDQRRPRVLWAAPARQPLLEQLAQEVTAAIVRCGIVLEERSFTPHITLARIKAPARPDLVRFLNASCAALPPLAVTGFHLFSSTLSPQGALHTLLQSFPLPQVMNSSGVIGAKRSQK